MSVRLMAWLWRRFRPVEGRSVFLLLVLAVLSAAVGGTAAGWVPGDELFWHTALVGMLAGRGLARTRMRGRWAVLLLTTGGAVYAGWWTSRLAAPLWAALRATWSEDWPLALTWLREAGTRVVLLAGEVVAWIGSWVGWGGTPGPMVSLFWMALLLWGGAAFAGWSAARGRHPLIAFLPLGAALTLSVYLGDAGMMYLWFFVACIVAMSPPLTLRRREWEWDSRQVAYSEEFRTDVLAVALTSAAVFLVVAVAFPNIRVRAMVNWFWQQAYLEEPQQTAGEVLERAFPGARPAAGGGPRGGAAGATLPREHLLSGGPDLERTVVMQVALAAAFVDDGPPPVPHAPLYDEVRPSPTFYWRGTAYDEYVGAGWRQGRMEAASQPPYAALGPSERSGRRPLRQEFTLLGAHGQTLYAAGDPHSLDQAVTTQRLSASGDLVALEGPAESYHVLSLVPWVTARELAESPATYPPWIEEVYLALPDGLPRRVVELAREVTAEADTPYARALALETYLRSFPYDLEIAKPPEGRDVVDYFLFDLQRGYCDYFASAMVVMARSVHIPARLAVGYAMGHYDPQQGAYVVTEKDGHAWPELYFPDYGWIPFEPTSGLGTLERAEDVDAEMAELLPSVFPSRPERPWWVRLQVETRLIWLRYRWWALAGVGLLLAATTGWRLWAWERRPTGLNAAERVVLSYDRLRRAAPRLGVAVRPCDTPAEFAAAMKRGLVRRRPCVAWLRAVVQGEVEQALGEVALVTSLYEQISYAPARPDPDLMRRVWREGRRLRRRLWRLRAISTAVEDR